LLDPGKRMEHRVYQVGFHGGYSRRGFLLPAECYRTRGSKNWFASPVGIVDAGRISLDTGHTFEATKDAAPGVAARYYMNRNFFVSDPDAFCVSKQTVTDQPWHGGKVPLTLDEAKASIALSAVAGGMYEIGDDLPALGADAERLALVQN